MPSPPVAPVSVLIATRARPEALARALRSIAQQQASPAEVLVLDNASPAPLAATDLPALDVPLRLVRSEVLLGVGAARRHLCEAAQAPLALLLDDDAWLPDAHALAQVVAHFEAHPQSAALGFAVAHEQPGGIVWRTPVGTRAQAPAGPPCEAGCFLGGAHALRLAAVAHVGGYDAAFEYGEEELDLTYRLVAAGHGVWYDPALVAHHRRPLEEPARVPAHTAAARLKGRAFLAARYLPLPYALTFIGAWGAYAWRQAPGQPRALLRAVVEGVQQARQRGRCALPAAAVRKLRRTNGRLWM